MCYRQTNTVQFSRGAQQLLILDKTEPTMQNDSFVIVK